jgi:hypothetical protein
VSPDPVAMRPGQKTTSSFQASSGVDPIECRPWENLAFSRILTKLKRASLIEAGSLTAVCFAVMQQIDHRVKSIQFSLILK